MGPRPRQYHGSVDEVNGKGSRSTLGVLGVIVTMLSIWWFALRPRRRRG